MNHTKNGETSLTPGAQVGSTPRLLDLPAAAAYLSVSP